MTVNIKPSFIGYLHSFRGFAIINIVAIHAVGLAGMLSSRKTLANDSIQIANQVLFHNSTIYFAIISGMLYTAILKRKGVKSFFVAKFKYIFVPYVFFTLAYSIFDNKAHGFFILQPNLEAYLNASPSNFLYGKACFVFWYMPILFFMYLATPILDYIMRIEKWGNYIIAIVALIPLVVRRVELDELLTGDFLSLQTMVYFTGAYAAGMLIATKLEARMEWMRRNWLIFAAVASLSTAALLYVIIFSIDRFDMFSIQSTLYYAQKMAFSVLFLVLFKIMGDSQPKWLHPVAGTAFTIYFAHAFFLGVSLFILMPVIQYNIISPFNILLASILMIAISTLLSIGFARVFQKLFGKNSRRIIGS